MKRNLLFTPLFSAAVFLAACGGNQTAQEQADTAVTQAAAVPPSGITFKETALNALWPKYENLQKALAADDQKAAQTAAGELSSALDNAPGNEKLAAATKVIATETEIKKQRKLFAEVSTTLIAQVKKSGLASGTLYLQNCPMYAGGKGGDWLSADKEIKNPYYGSEMLECGSVKETLK
ncbi:MAG: DUF3347 domain-containing protein [Mucilaginibacter polytrichastri]|nr:DUF3347 domain-containing protein [Mucilaginibacter polytrichastri]